MARRVPTPRELSEQQEPRYLFQSATKSTDVLASHREYPQTKDDYRTEFERDYTRIIHSRAFRRLRHKTQIFISPENDHLCTRLEHSLYVASIGRTISKALGLNNELIAAIAVGHDLGHPPFGHEGQRCLNAKAACHGISFWHERHSLRVVDRLESPYKKHVGLNLTFAVRDGIACHRGEEFERRLVPDRSKTPNDLNAVKPGDTPATLEGCVVRFADKVAYLGRDLEDAVAVGIVKRTDLPKAVKSKLGTTNRRIIAALIHEIVRQSKGHDYIAVGSEVHRALNQFNSFNLKRIYGHEKVVKSFPQIDRAMPFMFDEFYSLITKARLETHDGRLFPGRREECVAVLQNFLRRYVRDWRAEEPAQLAIDHIAAMTDAYFVRAFEELFLPKSTV